ncbi:hypothetical protein [Thalassomonas actiniarum]|uniref:Uncharacterized protein n=1 Tax=Thalassomonas actiniarum TaxID=485447 RepID=A0AAF0C766_9GAMM|nr:hypothetical protein [Thalassomonas actiniarum]WDE02549.1 hypothetical protein SG35_029535 [Thalassomonas actiniarum]
MYRELINILAARVLQEQVKQPWLTIEEILNDAGVCGLSIGAMVEARAAVYYRLGRGLTQPGELKAALGNFIFDYPVFRWSELRFYFQGDPKDAIKALLTAFKYTCRYISEQEEFVWAPMRMWNVTVRHQLARRAKVGSIEYFTYLNYRQKEQANSVCRY